MGAEALKLCGDVAESILKAILLCFWWTAKFWYFCTRSRGCYVDCICTKIQQAQASLQPAAGPLLWYQSHRRRPRHGGTGKLHTGEVLQSYLSLYGPIDLSNTGQLERSFKLQEADKILQGADEADVAFLVVGDPFGYVSFSLSVRHSLSRCFLPLFR